MTPYGKLSLLADICRPTGPIGGLNSTVRFLIEFDAGYIEALPTTPPGYVRLNCLCKEIDFIQIVRIVDVSTGAPMPRPLNNPISDAFIAQHGVNGWVVDSSHLSAGTPLKAKTPFYNDYVPPDFSGARGLLDAAGTGRWTPAKLRYRAGRAHSDNRGGTFQFETCTVCRDDFTTTGHKKGFNPRAYYGCVRFNFTQSPLSGVAVIYGISFDNVPTKTFEDVILAFNDRVYRLPPP